MSKPIRVNRSGNGYQVIMDDGARYLAIHNGSGSYIVGGSGATPPNPDPDPDPDPPIDPPTGDFMHPMGAPWPYTSYSEIDLGYPPGSHDGGALDFPCGVESPPLYAACTGQIAYAGWEEGGGGNVVGIAAPGGDFIVYAHLSSISVTVGQTVNIGDIVGLVGMTGTASGNHLHLEVRNQTMNWGTWHRALDYFAARGVAL